MEKRWKTECTTPSPYITFNMKNIQWDTGRFLNGEKATTLVSGEFHYFRVPREDWRKRLELWRDAGGQMVATYVPWIVHAPEEGRFDFGRETSWRDVRGFLELCGEMEMPVLVRPGPYQYSELKFGGLPPWLFAKYPDLLALDARGKIIFPDTVSYLHPVFLEKARIWLEQVVPILAEFSIDRGGPVVLSQPDNETSGYHLWRGSPDCHPVSMGFGRPDGRWPRWLESRYGSMNRLNTCYKTRFASFADVALPESEDGTSSNYLWRKDYFDFYCGTVAEYLGWILDRFTEGGLTVPAVHNSANPHMNAIFRETATLLGSRLLIGTDLYYNLGEDCRHNNPSPQQVLDMMLGLDSLRLMGFPPAVLEMQGGSPADWPPIQAQDLKAWYYSALAFGMKGVNYYVFTGGPNPPEVGLSGDTYDYGAAIGMAGEIRPHYHVQKELAEFCAAHPWLAESERERDLDVLMDWDAARAKHFDKGKGGWGLHPGEALDALMGGLLTTALCEGYSPGFVGEDEWSFHRPLVVASGRSMPAQTQESLARWVKAGGHLLLHQVVPDLDEFHQPCRILGDSLGAPLQADTLPCAEQEIRLTVGDLRNVSKRGPVWFFDSPPDHGETCGYDETTGKGFLWRRSWKEGGRVVVMGYAWRHARLEHGTMLRSCLDWLGAVRKVEKSAHHAWVTMRTCGERTMVFVMNPYSSPLEMEIACQPSWAKTSQALGRHRLDAMDVKTFVLEKDRA